MVRGVARQFNGGKLAHYQTRRVDLEPAIDRTKRIAQAATGKSEYKYLGSISRVVIDDWLRKQQKTWHEYATDRDLKAKFMVWYRSTYPKLMANAYQERKQKIIRKVTAPKLGATILKEYQAEASREQTT